MESNELLFPFLISVGLLGSLVVWVLCLHGCEHLVRGYRSGRQERRLSRQERRLSRQMTAEELSEAAQVEGIA